LAIILEPTMEYVISLRATNNVGDGQPAYANVRTPERFVSESAVPLIPPVGLKAIVLSASTVVLYWTDTTLSKSQVCLYFIFTHTHTHTHTTHTHTYTKDLIEQSYQANLIEQSYQAKNTHFLQKCFRQKL